MSEAAFVTDTPGFWTARTIEHEMRRMASYLGMPFRDLCKPLRLAITGREHSPPIFKVMEVLGEAECLARLRDPRWAVETFNRKPLQAQGAEV